MPLGNSIPGPRLRVTVRAQAPGPVSAARRAASDPADALLPAAPPPGTRRSRTAQSRTALSEYAQQANPMARVGQEMVSVEVRSAVELSPKTYHVRWVEHVVTREGATKERIPMAGSFTIEFKAPRDERRLLVNPLGLYVAAFSWSREL